MKLAVIIPVFNGGTDVLECLKALTLSTYKAGQIIVVDDGSSDNQAYIASKTYGCTWVRLHDGPGGPARARNLGALHARDNTDILVFIDADVVVSPDTLEQIKDRFLLDAETDAIFGSYDDKPRSRATISIYRNLLHHYVHQTGNPEARTFWAGCGAVRSHVFNAADGFSENYDKPSIEDIEFGARLHQHGYRIRLCPEIQVKHLKHWTLSNMIRTDVFCRAIPWTRLLWKDKSQNNHLNLRTRNKLSALAAILMTLSVPAIAINPLFSILTGMLFLCFVALDYPLLSFFYRTDGLKFAIQASLLHILYYWYASTAFAFTQLHLTTLPIVEKFRGIVAGHKLTDTDHSTLSSIAPQNNFRRTVKAGIGKLVEVHDFALLHVSATSPVSSERVSESRPQPVDESVPG